MTDLDIIDAEVVSEDLTYAEARDLTDEIKGDLDAIWEKVKIAWHGKAWRALGHKSWDDYCATEFRSSGLALPREERPEVVRSLAQSGLSVRGIASATGVSKSAVSRDLAGVPNGTPEPREQIGADGKTYTVPARHVATANVNTETGEIHATEGEARAADRDQLRSDRADSGRFDLALSTIEWLADPHIAETHRRIHRLIGVDPGIQGSRHNPETLHRIARILDDYATSLETQP